MMNEVTLKALLLSIALLALNGCAVAILGGTAAGANAAHDRRGFSTVIDDHNIKLSAYDAINRDKELALKNNVRIVVHNGVMLLIGQVRTQALKERAERLAGQFSGIRKLINELLVAEPKKLRYAVKDKWLSGRVKTALLDIVDMPGFDPTRVNVTTESATVYLMGLVSHEESDRVVEIARTVPGVERVVKVFEYEE